MKNNMVFSTLLTEYDSITQLKEYSNNYTNIVIYALYRGEAIF